MISLPVRGINKLLVSPILQSTPWDQRKARLQLNLSFAEFHPLSYPVFFAPSGKHLHIESLSQVSLLGNPT